MHMHYLSAKFGGSHPVLRYWHFFRNSRGRLPPSWIFMINTFRREACLFLGLCTKHGSCCTIAENNFVSDVRLMTSYELTSGSVLVIWATPRGRVAYAVPNVVQTSSFNTEILAFTKFNMIAVRHLGFVRGSRATVHEGPFMVAINTSTV